MSNILKMNDFVGAGFERLDDTALEQHPPKIQWGQLYRDMDYEHKVHYLERVASAMNHAAAKIQGERDALMNLCTQKEKQLQSMATQISQNNAMLQSEVTRMNSDKQQMLQEIARLRAEQRK